MNVFYGRSHALQGVDLNARTWRPSLVGGNGMGKYHVVEGHRRHHAAGEAADLFHGEG